MVCSHQCPKTNGFDSGIFCPQKGLSKLSCWPTSTKKSYAVLSTHLFYFNSNFFWSNWIHQACPLRVDLWCPICNAFKMIVSRSVFFFFLRPFPWYTEQWLLSITPQFNRRSVIVNMIICAVCFVALDMTGGMEWGVALVVKYRDEDGALQALATESFLKGFWYSGSPVAIKRCEQGGAECNVFFFLRFFRVNFSSKYTIFVVL